MQTYESLRVFISGPKDVADECKIAQQVIDGVSKTCRDALGLAIETVTFDDFVPQTPRLPEERIQDILNAEIPKCHMFVLILSKSYGSTEPGYKKSNTEREAETALALLKKEKKLMFLSYFRDIPPNEDVGPQQQSVVRFRKSLEKRGVWYKRYNAVDQFKGQLNHDLYRTVMRYRLSTNKNDCLSRFWIFGTPDRITYPHLAIIYPSMGRAFMGTGRTRAIWLNRLVPNIVFEDFKALQKTEKTLRLLGFRDFRIYNTANTPSDLQFMNRFWICLPRSPRGLQQASLYQKVSRFTVIPAKNLSSTLIRWRRSVNSAEAITVMSPLARYLQEQRAKLDVSGEWHREMEHIIAKDFAILARFQDTFSYIAMKEGKLQDYFLAGIRGLGTWGAAWFLDRKYHTFENLKDQGNVQFLLETEYRDGRIFDVRDVSDKPQSYFDAENSIAGVKKNIADFRQ